MINSFTSWKAPFTPMSPGFSLSVSPPGRPVVHLRGDLTIQADLVLEALRRVNQGHHRIFQQGRRLVRRIHDPLTDRNRLEPIGSSKLLAGEIVRLLQLQKNGRTLDTLPGPLADHLFGLEPEQWQVPMLHAIRHVPFFDPQGNLIETGGYHAAQGIWLDLGDLKLPEVPSCPTSAQVSSAKALIDDLLADFPFDSTASRANALSLILLPSVRLMVRGPAPLFLNSASMPGSGKTALAQVPGVLHGGEIPAVMPEPPRDDEELTKRIVGVLQAGQELAIFDNVNRKLDSSILAGLATSTTFSGRALYQQEPLSLPNRTQWVFTANNPVMSKEFERRFLLIRLDPGVENPQNRTFRHPDLHQWILAHRPELLWAVLVLVRSWQAAGSPSGAVLEGGMRQFCEVLGGLTEFLGFGPVFANRTELTEQAGGDDQDLGDALACWFGAHATRSVTASDLGQLWEKAGVQPAGLNGYTAVHIGRYMQGQRGVVLGGYRINLSRSGRNTRYHLSLV